MTICLYMDHNVVRAVVDGCRSKGLDVLTAYEDGWHEKSDVEVLARAASLVRIVFTQDTGFIVLAAECQALGVPFAGVIFARHGDISIRKVIDDLVLICNALDVENLSNKLIWLPL